MPVLLADRFEREEHGAIGEVGPGDDILVATRILPGAAGGSLRRVTAVFCTLERNPSAYQRVRQARDA
jgi:hypothetical protein